MAETSVLFEYSEKQIDWLLRCTSTERMQPYYLRAENDAWTAFHLYVRNNDLSASLYKVLQALEVALRNVIHARLTEDLGTEEWWRKLNLRQPELDDIEAAKEHIEMRLKKVKPGRVVAELSFGFWVKLFANAYEKELWVRHTYKIFPAKLSRKLLHTRLTELKDLRNRIAHHETLMRRDPVKDYKDLMETIGWISPTLRKWVTHHSDFEKIFSRAISTRPVPLISAEPNTP